MLHIAHQQFGVPQQHLLNLDLLLCCAILKLGSNPESGNLATRCGSYLWPPVQLARCHILLFYNSRSFWRTNSQCKHGFPSKTMVSLVKILACQVWEKLNLRTRPFRLTAWDHYAEQLTVSLASPCGVPLQTMIRFKATIVLCWISHFSCIEFL